jgi:hypothetical protein
MAGVAIVSCNGALLRCRDAFAVQQQLGGSNGVNRVSCRSSGNSIACSSAVLAAVVVVVVMECCGCGV